MRIQIIPKLLLGACLLALTACGGGGGGTMTAASTTSSGSTMTSTQTFTVTMPALSGTSGVTLPVANASTPSFSTSARFGVAFPLDQAVLTLTATSVTGDADPATITLTGFDSATNYSLFELKIPNLNLDVTNLRSDYTAVNLPDGTKVRMFVGGGLQYMYFAQWGVIPPTTATPAHYGFGTTGYATPISGMPTSGTATYANGSANGNFGDVFYATSSGTGAVAGLNGQVNLNANFSTGTITGALTNMMAIPSDGSAATPWNSVNLSGTITGTGIAGTTSSSAPAATTIYTLGASAGHFYGNFYGPNANEVGAVWTLTDSTTPNKAAIGVLGVPKQ